MTFPVPPYGQPREAAEPQEAGPRMVRIQRPASRPIVTYTIMGITIFVFLLQEMTNSGIGRGPFLALGQAMFGAQTFQALLQQGWGSELLTLLGGKISPLIMVGQYWRLFTPLLLHASLLHIGFNMYALFVIGPSVESFYGRWRYLALYLLGGLGGNVLSFLVTPGPTPSIGASTAIFGLIAAEGVFVYQNRKIFGQQARAMLTNVVVIVVINLALGLSPGIDNFGHLGGLIAGVVFAWFAGPLLSVTYTYSAYTLEDQRPPVLAWLVGILLLIVLLGIVFLRVSQG